MSRLKIFGEHDEGTLAQINLCARENGSEVPAVLCADGHLGYSMPIGGVIGYREHVSPSGVGYDIGCGNKAVKTNIRYEDIDTLVDMLMDDIVKKVSFGMGRDNPDPVDHPVLDRIRDADFAPQRQFLDLAAKQLGTVGAGNHYVDLFKDEDGWVWIGVHFGSRGFGHKTASGFLSMADGGAFDDRAPDGEMSAPPVLLPLYEGLGQSYIAAMQLAGEYAYAGRDVVCEIVLDILGAEEVDSVHNHHNFAWNELHKDGSYWVVRKGATPAFPGQRGFVGASMGEPSVILEGVESPESAEALYSTVHGAGRAMSRTEAAGKKRKRWYCRQCGWEQGPGVPSPVSQRASESPCPSCRKSGDKVLNKKWITLKEGKINFEAVQTELGLLGIELRGGAADEAPNAYKRLDDVLQYHEGTVKVLHELTPIGVAMAGPDVIDNYKDG